MNVGVSGRLSFFTILVLAGSASWLAAETFRVATYNVENYLDAPAPKRHLKSPEAKAKVRESILAIKPDVLALEEMGTTNALLELRGSLKSAGLDLPYWEHITGADTNIHIAILSRFPIIARRPHTNDSFLLTGRRYRVGRGFAEVDVQVATNYTVTVLAAHLKSRRTVAMGDEAELRLEEAKLLRERVDALLGSTPEARLVVLGDLNDSKDAPSTKAIIGKGKRKLVDTRPAEREPAGTPPLEPASEASKIAWTHFYDLEDSFSRIDYILLSPALARDWVKSETYVLRIPNWAVGSDHRPIVASFQTSP